jgi:deoxyadenosine/deoxycytidine kinase
MKKEKVFIAVAGNIGSGKSSLTKLLSEHFGWKAYYESVDDNPYLDDFYKDMKRWSFNLQIYFLSKRFKDHMEIVNSPYSIIQDRSIYEDAEIFARNLYEMGNMDERDYKNYVELFNIMTSFLKPPDLIIYLRANVDTLLRQIKLRGRSFEQNIPREYLESLNKHYEDWISRYKLGEILILETDDLDFVNEKDDFKKVVEIVTEKLEKIGYEAKTKKTV